MADNKFKLEIISPDRVFYTGEASMLELNTSEGQMGIYANHIPLTAVLVPGICTIHEDGGEKYAALHAGFIEILMDKITVLAEIAEWPDEIDKNRAEEARIRAERRLSGAGEENVNMLRAEMALKRALTRIGLAEHK